MGLRACRFLGNLRLTLRGCVRGKILTSSCLSCRPSCGFGFDHGIRLATTSSGGKHSSIASPTPLNSGDLDKHRPSNFEGCVQDRVAVRSRARESCECHNHGLGRSSRQLRPAVILNMQAPLALALNLQSRGNKTQRTLYSISPEA